VNRPHIEIFATMAGRGMNEAGPGVVRDVTALKERDVELIAVNRFSKWMCTNNFGVGIEFGYTYHFCAGRLK